MQSHVADMIDFGQPIFELHRPFPTMPKDFSTESLWRVKKVAKQWPARMLTKAKPNQNCVSIIKKWTFYNAIQVFEINPISFGKASSRQYHQSTC